jgi:hypothetical protein
MLMGGPDDTFAGYSDKMVSGRSGYKHGQMWIQKVDPTFIKWHRGSHKQQLNTRFSLKMNVKSG